MNIEKMTKQQLIDEVKRLRIVLSDRVEESSLNCSSKIAEKYLPIFAGEKQECFYVVLLDNKYRPIKEIMVTKGTLNRSLVHPREVFAPAIEERSAAIIIMHNHPAGDPKPSTTDIDITKKLKDAGEIIGIAVIDHIVIGSNSYFSFVDEGIM